MPIGSITGKPAVPLPRNKPLGIGDLESDLIGFICNIMVFTVDLKVR
jgi:hypothetical protein